MFVKGGSSLATPYFFPKMTYLIDTNKALHPRSVLFQSKIIIIKLANNQGLIQFQVDESFPAMLNSLCLNRSTITAQFHLLATLLDLVGIKLFYLHFLDT